jgi:hypothetical protein
VEKSWCWENRGWGAWWTRPRWSAERSLMCIPSANADTISALDHAAYWKILPGQCIWATNFTIFLAWTYDMLYTVRLARFALRVSLNTGLMKGVITALIQRPAIALTKSRATVLLSVSWRALWQVSYKAKRRFTSQWWTRCNDNNLVSSATLN